MKKKIFFFLSVVVCFLSFSVAAQLPQRQKIALFLPLYLDSAFDAGGGYRYDKSFPKFLNPGLEFYQGAQAALDSLEKAGAPLEVFVYDSKSKRNPLAQQANSTELNGVGLMIGHTNTGETKMLAEVALRKQIPFVSATLPNDAGVAENPYYVVLNSTLRTHTEAIYKYIQKYYAGSKVIVFRKNGVQENLIKEYLQDFSRGNGNGGTKIQFAEVGADFSEETVRQYLDSSRRTVCIAGSLDENFGLKLAQTLSAFGKAYPVTLVGMPTWDGLNLTKNDFKPLEIIYSTPFNYGRWTALGTQLGNDFERKINGRPTDMYFRGYETLLRFALLLLDTKKDVASNLTRKGNYIFTQFDIQPVFLNNRDMNLDYFENKKIYFVRINNGVKTTQ